MNKDNASKFLPLVQALAEGKKIQYNSIPAPNHKWEDIAETGFISRPECYRIKPEPREFTVWLSEDEACVLHSDQSDHCGYGDKAKKIRVREILD